MTEWGIDTLFNPGKRHMDEEKRRLQSTREEVGDSSGGRRIDLESGTVRISRKAKATEADDEAAPVTEGEAAEIEAAKDEVEAEQAAESADQTARSGAEDTEGSDENSSGSKPQD
jgi:uncharacterized protein DUF6191